MNKTHFIKSGNISRVLRLLSGNPDGGLQDNSLQGLKIKDPEASLKYYGLKLRAPVNEVHDIIFNKIKEECIQKVAVRITGPIGPSKFGADDW